MDKKALQEQFEAIAVQNCWNINKYPAGWDGRGDDEYVDEFVNGAWWAFQHQQAKVEELQQENLRLAYGNTSYYNQAVKQNEIIDELQKRVNKCQQLIQKWNGGGYDIFDVFKEIEQALKGEG
ncbi:hypothetical protein [Acinetobacter baumannii]|uniref:hypothetical protein n=1 Tax=Acinetobacter baumannii TaxID=470 RepID=UPI00209B6713|nr:hypothetical protein [Acinetobacter baumannii]